MIFNESMDYAARVLLGFSQGRKRRPHFLYFYCLLVVKTEQRWYTFSMDRTVRIQLHPTPEQVRALTETLAQFTVTFNNASAPGWKNQEQTGRRCQHLP